MLPLRNGYCYAAAEEEEAKAEDFHGNMVKTMHA
jgi:hypothetical protein